MSLTPKDIDELAELNRAEGYAAGVQAARDAVAGLNPLCSGLCECLSDALAAIDALKEEQA